MLRTDPLSRTQRDLILSLVTLAIVVVIAIVGLATDRNWPKILRVGASFGAYCAVLLAFLQHGRATMREQASIPLHWFTIAAAAAGIISGLVRPQFDPGVLVVGTVASALLLGGVHCLALRAWRMLAPVQQGGAR